MIEKILNWLLGLFDDTYNSDEEAIEKIKVIERNKMKQLRR